jgi:hypothetical protein
MGLNTWAVFAGTDAEAMVAGDVAMLENEVPHPVVESALRPIEFFSKNRRVEQECGSPHRPRGGTSWTNSNSSLRDGIDVKMSL